MTVIQTQFNGKFEKIDYNNKLNFTQEIKSVNKLKQKTVTISLILPLYNEKRSIKEIIERIPQNGALNKYNFEIIIVDDGSTDGSIKAVRETYRNVKLIEHKENRGYGEAILTGFKHATGDMIITMDSDGQHNPEEIFALIQPIIKNQADIVVGSRYLGKSMYKVPFHTRLGEFCVNLLLSLFYHQKVGNNQSGFRAFNKKGAAILKNMIYTRFGICTETLFKAGANNLRIREIPITINERKNGSTSVRLLSITKSIISCVLIYAFKKLKLNKLIPNKYKNDLTENLIQAADIKQVTSIYPQIDLIQAAEIIQVASNYPLIDLMETAEFKPKVSIIFPSYNGEKFLARNLDSIRNQPNINEIELIIIDNDSHDSSIDIINSYRDSIHINLIKKNENLGFAKACNIGANHAKGEFIFITNQDVIFPPNFFQKIYPKYIFYNHKAEIMISPALIFEGTGGEIHYFGAKNHLLGFSYTKELGQILPKEAIIKRTQRCSGGTLFMKREMFLKMGGFDSTLFMYYEDTDLSLRFLRKGLKIYTTNDPFLIHQKQEIILSDFRYYLLERNRYISYFKNIDSFKQLRPYFLISEIILIFQSIISKKFRLRIRMYYELFVKRKLLKNIREKSKKEAPLLPLNKLSHILDAVLIGKLKNSKILSKFLNLFNYLLKKI